MGLLPTDLLDFTFRSSIATKETIEASGSAESRTGSAVRGEGSRSNTKSGVKKSTKKTSSKRSATRATSTISGGEISISVEASGSASQKDRPGPGKQKPVQKSKRTKPSKEARKAQSIRDKRAHKARVAALEAERSVITASSFQGTTVPRAVGPNAGDGETSELSIGDSLKTVGKLARDCIGFDGSVTFGIGVSLDYVTVTDVWLDRWSPLPTDPEELHPREFFLRALRKNFGNVMSHTKLGSASSVSDDNLSYCSELGDGFSSSIDDAVIRNVVGIFSNIGYSYLLRKAMLYDNWSAPPIVLQLCNTEGKSPSALYTFPCCDEIGFSHKPGCDGGLSRRSDPGILALCLEAFPPRGAFESFLSFCIQPDCEVGYHYIFSNLFNTRDSHKVNIDHGRVATRDYVKYISWEDREVFPWNHDDAVVHIVYAMGGGGDRLVRVDTRYPTEVSSDGLQLALCEASIVPRVVWEGDVDVLFESGPVFRFDRGDFHRLYPRHTSLDVLCCGGGSDDSYFYGDYYRDAKGNKRKLRVAASTTLVVDMLSSAAFLRSETEASIAANQFYNRFLVEKKKLGTPSSLEVSEILVAASLAGRIWKRNVAVMADISTKPVSRIRFPISIFYTKGDVNHMLSPAMYNLYRPRIIVYRVVLFATLVVLIGITLAVVISLNRDESMRRRLERRDVSSYSFFLFLVSFVVYMFKGDSHKRKLVGMRPVIPRMCLDRTHVNKLDIRKLNRGLVMLELNELFMGEPSADELYDRLPCNPRYEASTVLKGPYFINIPQSTGFHTCARTLTAAVLGRALAPVPAPAKKVLREYLDFYRSVVIPQAMDQLVRFKFSFDDWLEHVESSKRNAVIKSHGKYVLGKSDLPNTAESFVKVDEKFPLYSKIPRPRCIIAASPDIKPIEGPFYHALESCWDYKSGTKQGLRGYCGSKNWTELADAISSAWNRMSDPVFVMYDVSGFDASQHAEIMSVTDSGFYEKILANDNVKLQLSAHYGACYPKLVSSVRNISISSTARFNTPTGRKVLMKWVTKGGVPSGRNNTTEGNTRRSASYFQFACFRKSIPEDKYEFWAKGDDLLAIVERDASNVLMRSLREVFTNGLQTGGLGMLLKSIEVGGVNDLDFVSLNAFRSSGRFVLIRQIDRFLSLTPWTQSIYRWEKTRENFIIMRNLQWSEFKNIEAWTGGVFLNIFTSYSRVLLAYSKHSRVGGAKLRYRQEGSLYSNFTRSQIVGADVNVDFSAWLFDKYGITGADCEEFDAVCDKEIDRVSKGLGPWEQCGSYVVPVPQSIDCNLTNKIFRRNTPVEMPSVERVFAPKIKSPDRKGVTFKLDLTGRLEV